MQTPYSGQFAADSSKKRKMVSDTEEPSDTPINGYHGIGNIKRVKLELAPDLALRSYRTADGHLPQDRSFLPAEIWHYNLYLSPPQEP